MQRTVSSRLDLPVTEPADLVFSVAVAADLAPTEETLSVTVDDQPVETTEIVDGTTRLHRIPAAPVGRLRLAYDAVAPQDEPTGPVTDLEAIVFTRPSRYCDSDRLSAVAHSHFGDLAGAELVQAVVSWALTHIPYAPGASGPVDGALETTSAGLASAGTPPSWSSPS